MIYIAVATYIEAKPLITKFNLKRDNDTKRFQLFKNDRYILIITGVGILESCIALTYILKDKNIKERDIFINLGICGAKSSLFSLGDIVYVNKVISSVNSKVFYPDILFKHSFKEGSLESFFKVVTDKNIVNADIVDMEGFGVYQTVSHFFQNHQIYIFKVVSDFLEGSFVENGVIEKVMNRAVEEIFDWILEIEKELDIDRMGINSEDRIKIEKVAKRLNFTETMYHKFCELLNYYKLNGGDIETMLKRYDSVELSDKKRVKIEFERVRKEIME